MGARTQIPTGSLWKVCGGILFSFPLKPSSAFAKSRHHRTGADVFSEANTFFIGQSKTCDLNKDTDGGGNPIGQNRNGQKFQLGCDVVLGDDDWIDGGQLFQYDQDSNMEVTIRKYGGVCNGDVSYDGYKEHHQVPDSFWKSPIYSGALTSDDPVCSWLCFKALGIAKRDDCTQIS